LRRQHLLSLISIDFPSIFGDCLKHYTVDQYLHPNQIQDKTDSSLVEVITIEIQSTYDAVKIMCLAQKPLDAVRSVNEVDSVSIESGSPQRIG
jgi:hypothetical protein